MPKLTVEEASTTYESAMRNVLPVGPRVCATCHTFIGDGWQYCIPCSRQPSELDLVVPITYSEDRGQMHHGLRNYKDGYGAAKSFAKPRVAAILWRFLELHERCVAAAAHVDAFDLVTVVPSTSPTRDSVSALRTIVGWCAPIRDRLATVLTPTGVAPSSHSYESGRYQAQDDLTGARILLIDDTWTTGGHAQSAAYVLRRAGAATVAMIVIGRHVDSNWQTGATTNQAILAELPRFDWDRCCVHERGD